MDRIPVQILESHSCCLPVPVLLLSNPMTFFSFFFNELFSYLEEFTETGRDKERELPSFRFTLQMMGMSSPGPSQGQGPGTLLWGWQGLDPFSTAFLGVLAGSWTRRGAAGTQTDVHRRYCSCWLHMLPHHVAPFFFVRFTHSDSDFLSVKCFSSVREPWVLCILGFCNVGVWVLRAVCQGVMGLFYLTLSARALWPLSGSPPAHIHYSLLASIFSLFYHFAFGLFFLTKILFSTQFLLVVKCFSAMVIK